MAKSVAKPPKPLSLKDQTRWGDNRKQIKRDWLKTHVRHVFLNQKDIMKVLQEFETKCLQMTMLFLRGTFLTSESNNLERP